MRFVLDQDLLVEDREQIFKIPTYVLTVMTDLCGQARVKAPVLRLSPS